MADATGGLANIKHLVVVMFENRSFDNLCGWLYPDAAAPPTHFLPAGRPQSYRGLNPAMWNPSNADYFLGQPAIQVPVVNGASNTSVPNKDPEETFDNVTYQLYGPQGPSPTPTWPMQGFVVNYENTGATTPAQIMQGYKPSQVPTLSDLARKFAICDEWFASVPSQTWPNRSFVHTGTANGNVNNGWIPDPFEWDVRTIFQVLGSIGVSWVVYDDTIIPPLARLQFPGLWDVGLNAHFRHLDDFKTDCAKAGALPKYSFLEPSFFFEPNDEHPPHDVTAGEQLLFEIWQAVSTSPDWNEILLVILFDEHGGCFDHVLPPMGAATPDRASDPGKEGFRFDRFGVRVPAVLVSPHIEAGTVFSTNTAVPYDHTSVLATLRDWIGIGATDMLPSARIASAPTFDQVLTRSSPREAPDIEGPLVSRGMVGVDLVPLNEPLNDLQRSIVAAAAKQAGRDPVAMLASIGSRAEAIGLFEGALSDPFGEGSTTTSG